MADYDSSDPAQVEKAQDEAARRQERVDGAFRRLVDDPDGRAWIWQELMAAKLFFEEGPTNEATMAWEKGWRNAALRLFWQVNRVRPDAFALMQREAAGQ